MGLRWTIMCNLNLSLWCPNVTVAFGATLRRWSICCSGVSWLLSCGIFLVVYHRWRSRRIWSLLIKGGLRWLGLHLIKELLLVCFRVLLHIWRERYSRRFSSLAHSSMQVISSIIADCNCVLEGKKFKFFGGDTSSLARFGF